MMGLASPDDDAPATGPPGALYRIWEWCEISLLDGISMQPGPSWYHHSRLDSAKISYGQYE